jgi:microcystin-dependent protein
MASTYTSNLGVEKPDSGDRSNTWGTMVNANMNILDRTASGERGTLTIPISGMPPATGWNYASTPQTLNLAPTSLGDGHYAALTVNDAGDLGFDVYLQVTPATVKRTISIRNSLSGARNLIIYQGTYNASYAYTVANGYDATIVIPGDGASAIAPLLNKPALTAAHTATLIDLIYPVGSIYIAAVATNPGTLFGVGTWESFGSEKMLRGISTGTAGTTGGADSVTLAEANIPAHSHDSGTLTGSAASAGGHTHGYYDTQGNVVTGKAGNSGNAVTSVTDTYRTTITAGAHTHTVSITGGTTGSYGQASPTAIDTVPAYITVYMWKRTA